MTSQELLEKLVEHFPYTGKGWFYFNGEEKLSLQFTKEVNDRTIQFHYIIGMGIHEYEEADLHNIKKHFK